MNYSMNGMQIFLQEREFISGNLKIIYCWQNVEGQKAAVQNGSCIQYVIEADGGIYPCDFYVLDQYCLGNINQISYQESEKRGQQIEFFQKSREIPPECSDCPYYLLCRNGCFRYRENDLKTSSVMLRFFFAYAGDRADLDEQMVI